MIFHVFDVQDFDFMIGHPIEKLRMDAPTQCKLDVRLGKETFFVQISRAANSLAEPSLDSEPIMEVMGILPYDSPESHLEKDAEKFIALEPGLSVLFSKLYLYGYRLLSVK